MPRKREPDAVEPEVSEDEIARRRDEGLKRALKTPPKPYTKPRDKTQAGEGR